MKPSNAHNVDDLVREWITHAESDLRYAELGQKDASILSAHICFHAQQAAEKAIKAVLTAHGIPFPLIHDLEELFRIVETARINIPPAVVEAVDLTPFAVQTRYPGDGIEIDPQETEQAVRRARVVVEWAHKLLSKH